MGLAATGSKKLTHDVAKASALELTSCGVNIIMGPVLDVLTNSRSQPLGSRSFGDDPREVTTYTSEYLKGLREGGVAAVGKHFPSYGNLEFFGHPTDVPTITDSLEVLGQSALVPFRSAIAAGIDAMMVGGVAMASSNMAVMHACLSDQVIQGILRQEMKFSGVVISECLEMEALCRNIGIGGGTVMAFQAGCDIIMTCRTLSVQEEAINGLQSGLDNGIIDHGRIQESFDRVMKLKGKYTSWDKAFAPLGIDNLMRLQSSHINLSLEAYNKSITVVRDQKQYIPLKKLIQGGEPILLLTPLLKPLPASAAARHFVDRTNMPSPDKIGSPDSSASSSMESVFAEFGRNLAKKSNLNLYHTSYTQNGLRPLHESLISQSQAVIVITADAGRNLYQSSFAKYVSMLCKMNLGYDGNVLEKPCIVVAVSSPFDFISDNTISTYICTYDFTEAALQTLVRVLLGTIQPTGTLPSQAAQGQLKSRTRQQWLVENFEETRDSKALNTMLAQVQREKSLNAGLLAGASAATFLLYNNKIDEIHFVVRNTSTKEILGFCATYYFPSTGKGYIGAIIVDPERRKMSIGHSLHTRAVRFLLKRPGLNSITLGVRLPGLYTGLPKSDANSYLRTSKFFTKLGWTLSASCRPVASATLTSLPSWSAPSGLGQTLANADVKYDLVHGFEYAEAVLDHVRLHAPEDVQELYRLALQQSLGCGIIRAKRASDGAVQGTVILCFRADVGITCHFPSLSTGMGMNVAQAGAVGTGVGGILAPVVAKTNGQDGGSLVQGLVLLGVRQLKRQGAGAAFVDCVSTFPDPRYLPISLPLEWVSIGE